MINNPLLCVFFLLFTESHNAGTVRESISAATSRYVKGVPAEDVVPLSPRAASVRRHRSAYNTRTHGLCYTTHSPSMGFVAMVANYQQPVYLSGQVYH